MRKETVQMISNANSLSMCLNGSLAARALLDAPSRRQILRPRTSHARSHPCTTRQCRSWRIDRDQDGCPQCVSAVLHQRISPTQHSSVTIADGHRSGPSHLGLLVRRWSWSTSISGRAEGRSHGPRRHGGTLHGPLGTHLIEIKVRRYRSGDSDSRVTNLTGVSRPGNGIDSLDHA